MRDCYNLTPSEYSDFLDLGYTLVSGPHDTQMLCTDVCDNGSGSGSGACDCDNLPTVINLNINLTNGTCTDCASASGVFALTQTDNNCMWQSPDIDMCPGGGTFWHWLLTNPGGVWTLWLVKPDTTIAMEYILDNGCTLSGELTISSGDSSCNISTLPVIS